MFSWTEFAESSVLIAVVAWLIRSLTKYILDRDLSSQIERLKADLRVEAFQRETTFSRMHEKQADVIADVYAKLHELFEAVSRLVAILESGETTKVELSERCRVAVSDFNEAFYPHRLYVPAPLDTEIKDFAGELVTIANDFMFGFHQEQSGKVHDWEKRKDYWGDAFNKVSDKANPVFNDLREKFRDLIGVNLEKEKSK